MKINIQDKELELHYSMRIYIIYENMMDKSIEPDDFYKYTNILTLLYATIIATLQYNRLPATLDWNDYMDWLDDNNGQEIINEFGIWFSTVAVQQQNLIPVDEEGKKKKKVKKSKNQ